MNEIVENAKRLAFTKHPLLVPAYLAAIGLLLIGLNFAFDLWRDIRYTNCFHKKGEWGNLKNMREAIGCAARYGDPQFPLQDQMNRN